MLVHARAWRERRAVAKRFAVSAALLALASYLSMTDTTQAAFTATTGTGPSTFTTAVVDLTAGGAGLADRFTVDAAGLVPGDRVERALDLTNRANLDLAGVTLTTTATQSSALDTDTTHGVQVSIETCTVPWTETGPAPGYTYTCAGATGIALSSRPAIMNGAAVTGLAAATAGATAHLRVVLTLPAAAGDALQGLTSRIGFAFTASSAP